MINCTIVDATYQKHIKGKKDRTKHAFHAAFKFSTLFLRILRTGATEDTQKFIDKNDTPVIERNQPFHKDKQSGWDWD